MTKKLIYLLHTVADAVMAFPLVVPKAFPHALKFCYKFCSLVCVPIFVNFFHKTEKDFFAHLDFVT